MNHHLLRTVFLLLAAVSIFSLLPGNAAHAAEGSRAPNIVLIFADDLGWQDTGFTGSDYYETPHLDRLAREGMVFRQAYAAAGNCAPSRACLLSGQYTPRHGVYAVGSTNRGPKELMRMRPVPNTSGLGPDDFTLPKAMKSAGYVTGMFGKWHLDGSGGSKPQQHFDVVAADAHSWRKQAPDDPKGVFTITEAACRFMEENRDRPFFAYLPHYAVHTPIQSRADVTSRFRQKTRGEKHKDEKYAACIAELDTSIGMLLEKLAELDLAQNTLVLFTSDNGGTAESQEPLRGKKGSYYEGGIREPMIVRWPGVVRPGSTCDVPVINVDFYPTFLAAAGAAPPSDRSLDGESLLPLLRGEPSLAREAIFWHFPGYLDGPVQRGRDPVFRTRPVSVIRQGDWKLHLYHEEWLLDGGREQLATNGAVELYNVADDPREMHDVAASNTAKRDELLDHLLAWFDHAEAKLPSEENPQYDPAAKRGKK